MHRAFWLGNLKEQGHSEDLDLDWKIKLKWINLRTRTRDNETSSSVSVRNIFTGRRTVSFSKKIRLQRVRQYFRF